MVGVRRKGSVGALEVWGVAKRKNFYREEKEQLCRSVLHVTQDRVIENQQRGQVFWERIAEHYN